MRYEIEGCNSTGGDVTNAVMSLFPWLGGFTASIPSWFNRFISRQKHKRKKSIYVKINFQTEEWEWPGATTSSNCAYLGSIVDQRHNFQDVYQHPPCLRVILAVYGNDMAKVMAWVGGSIVDGLTKQSIQLILLGSTG